MVRNRILRLLESSTGPGEDPNHTGHHVVQADVAARCTFRFDRVYGRVHQLAEARDGGRAWQELDRKPHPSVGGLVESGPNFQLFLSALTARVYVLLNMRTGAS